MGQTTSEPVPVDNSGNFDQNDWSNGGNIFDSGIESKSCEIEKVNGGDGVAFKGCTKEEVLTRTYERASERELEEFLGGHDNRINGDNNENGENVLDLSASNVSVKVYDADNSTGSLSADLLHQDRNGFLASNEKLILPAGTKLVTNSVHDENIADDKESDNHRRLVNKYVAVTAIQNSETLVKESSRTNRISINEQRNIENSCVESCTYDAEKNLSKDSNKEGNSCELVNTYHNDYGEQASVKITIPSDGVSSTQLDRYDKDGVVSLNCAWEIDVGVFKEKKRRRIPKMKAVQKQYMKDGDANDSKAITRDRCGPQGLQASGEVPSCQSMAERKVLDLRRW